MAFKLSCFADEIGDDIALQTEIMARAGVGGCELRSAFGKNVTALDDAQLFEVKRHFDGCGVAVSAIGSPVGKIGIGDDFDGHMPKFERSLRAAEVMQTRFIRVFSFYMPKDCADPGVCFDEVCRRLERLIDRARRENVVLLHENEKDIFGDIAPRCEMLFERLYCENFAMTFDPANFVQCGQNVRQAMDALKKYVRYIHIKDAMFADGRVVPAGHGEGEIAYVLSEAAAQGYDGFLSLEPHLGDFTGLAGLENGRELEFDNAMTAPERFLLAAAELRRVIAEAGLDGYLK